MEARNPDYRKKVQEIFERAPFVQKLGIEIVSLGPGRCETRLTVLPWHRQQNGFVHAGVVATLADHTAGAAAGSLIDATQGVLSIEFKVNFLRAAQGEELICRSTVLKPGRTLSFVEAEVWSGRHATPVMFAKASVTLAIVPDTTDPDLAKGT